MMANAGDSSEKFFQSDAQLEAQKEKAEKSLRLEKVGDPIKCTSKVLIVAPSHIEGAIWIAESGSLVRLLDLKSGKSLLKLKDHRGPVTSISIFRDFSDGSTCLATGSWDKSIRTYRLKEQDGDIEKLTAELKYVIENAHNDFVKTLTTRVYTANHPIFGGDNSSPVPVLFSGSADKSIKMWDLNSGKCIRKVESHSRSVDSIALDYDGTTLYSGSSDVSVLAINLLDSSVKNFKGHRTNVLKVFYDFDREELWSASADNTVRRWNIESRKSENTFEHPNWVHSFVIYGGHLISGCSDGNVYVSNVSTSEVKSSMEAHFDAISAMTIVGKYLVTGSYDGTVRKWDLKELLKRTGTQTQPLVIKPKVASYELTEEEEKELLELM